MQLQGKVAVVTGAAGGIGSAIAWEMAGEGARVAVADLKQAAAESVASEIRSKGGDAFAVSLDVTSQSAIKAMVTAVEDRLGAIDILVNNAGITRDAMYHKMTEQDFDAVIAVHLKGAWLCGQAVIHGMRERRYGKIVNISSIGGKLGNPGQTNYCAAKAGLVGYTKAAAKELGRYNINVNAIMPGLIDTPMIQTIPKEGIELRIQDTPLQRIGTPQDVAKVAVFLASEASSFMTGAIVEVTGGRGM